MGLSPLRLRSRWQAIRCAGQLPGMRHDPDPEIRRRRPDANQARRQFSQFPQFSRKARRGAAFGREKGAAGCANPATVKRGEDPAILAR